jgi:hypothetical protein
MRAKKWMRLADAGRRAAGMIGRGRSVDGGPSGLRLTLEAAGLVRRRLVSGLSARLPARVPPVRPRPPPYTAAAAKAVADFNAKRKEGENLQTEDANCVPPGMPRMMQMPYPVEFLFTPGRVTVLTEAYMQVRRIYTDGRKLPDDPDPQFNGNSIGHWEGDTLVVETVGLDPATTLMTAIHPTEQTKLVERIRQSAAGHPRRRDDDSPIRRLFTRALQARRSPSPRGRAGRSRSISASRTTATPPIRSAGRAWTWARPTDKKK